MGNWIDGKAIAQQIQADVLLEVQHLREGGVTPGLAVVLVGDHPASHVYVRSKIRTCRELGMFSEKVELPGDSSTDRVLEAVQRLNGREDVHGFLVQVPLPPQVDARRVLTAIAPEKDVDGLHPCNLGRLLAGDACLRPCTPAGIMEIFRRQGITLRGRRAVVIGRSDIVGKPLSIMLMHAHATVTICHSRTTDLAAVAREADVLVVAMGRAAFVDDSFVKPGAAVVDVGMNRVESPDEVRRIFGGDSARLADYAQKGYVLAGDVHAALVFPQCSFLTPVPGGVGPLTIAMLMSNAVQAAKMHAGLL